MRLTTDAAADDMPVWTPDGTGVVFNSVRADGMAIFEIPQDGSGPASKLVDALNDSLIVPMTWSAQGRELLISTMTTEPSVAFWTVPRRKPEARTPLFDSEVGLFPSLEISPDGRWAAYVSLQSGRSEVYVRRFPEGEGKRQVSVNGGIDPKWRADGRELFYVAADHNLMAVPMTLGGTADAGTPVALFQTRLAAATTGHYTRTQYVVADNGRRFLLNEPTGSAFPAPITVLVNWPERLRQ
jgi:hypothetical protein